MLESLASNVFEYKKLSPEEQKQRGILGRLTGIIADFKNPTRNGRIYSESLWDHVFNDPIMQEKIKNRCVFGELGHPADREEIDMEKIALCLAEQPKKGKDGKIYGVFDIMDTPNGRILKSLCDYGCNIGVSSRGSGDTFINGEGQEEVDESSYECQCWDAVLVPAVESARMNYVTESLNKKRYNKTLKESLEKVISTASEDDRKVMKESLNTLGISLNESVTTLYIKKKDLPEEQVEDFLDALASDASLNYDVKGDKITIHGNDTNIWNIAHRFDLQWKLRDIDENLNEDDLHDIFRKDAKDQYKAFNRKKDAYAEKEKKLGDFLDDVEDPEKKAHYKELILGKEPVFKYKEGHNQLERQNYPFYVTVYEGTSYFHPEEGGYYEAGLEPTYSEGYQTFEEAQQALQKYLEENGSTTVAFNPSNLSSDDDNYSYSESEEEYKPIYDSKDKLIGAIASGKYIGEEEQVWIESNKQYLKKQSGYHAYESLNEATVESSRSLKPGKEFTSKSGHKLWIDEVHSSFSGYDGSPVITLDFHYKLADGEEGTGNCNTVDLFRMLREGLYESLDESPDQKVFTVHVYQNFPFNAAVVLNDKLDKNGEGEKHTFISRDELNTFAKDLVDKGYKNYQGYGSFKNINTAEAVDNNEAMVEELQNTLKQKHELENQVASLQEELSVCHAKENKLNEEIGKHKTTIIKLTENMTKVRALKSKIEVLDKEKTALQEKLEKKSRELVKTRIDISKKQKSLDESYEAKKEKVNKLLETLRKDNQELKNTNKELETKFDELNESADSLKKDYELRNSDLSGKLEKSNKLVEKYSKIAKTAVDRYISEKATHIGVSTNEIVNKLPESYNFDDIDSVCEELRSYKLNLSRLPFNATLNESKKLKLEATSNKDSLISQWGDDVDDQLLKLAKLK